MFVIVATSTSLRKPLHLSHKASKWYKIELRTGPWSLHGLSNTFFILQNIRFAHVKQICKPNPNWEICEDWNLYPANGMRCDLHELRV